MLEKAKVARRRLVFTATFAQSAVALRPAGGGTAQGADQSQFSVIDFGSVGSGGRLDGVVIDPSSEAAVQLMSENGLQTYSNDAIVQITQSVRAATAGLSFAGLSLDEAVMLALQTARADPGVQGTLQSTRFECAGDCDGTGSLTIDELVALVSIALDNSPLSSCLVGDADHDGHIAINELILAVNAALGTCGYQAGSSTSFAGWH
jgi:hypothetical protein